MNEQTAQLLEQHFDTAFSAPNGIKKLRELILTLAMQGKLLAQDPSDKPASQLLKEIEGEKNRLMGAGQIKAPNVLPLVAETERPISLPASWAWVRLGEIGTINPRNTIDDSKLAGFVSMQMISEGYAEKHQFEERKWGNIKKGYTHFADGDVGMAKITPCFENAKSCVFAGLPSGIGAGTTELHVFRNSYKVIASRFLLYYLKNPSYIAAALPNMTGSAGQKRVPTPYFIHKRIALPPLTEQNRIVAKIDQLMARCDALEDLRNKRDEKRLATHAAALSQLLDTTSNDSAGDAWNFISQHFGDLYAVKENVAELRRAILQLAVQGKLVEHSEHQSKWELRPLKDLTIKIGSGSTPSGGKESYQEKGVPLIRSMNIHFGRFIHKGLVFLSETQAEKLKNVSVQPNDVLLNITGASIGRVALAPHEMTGARVNQHVCIIRPTKEIIPQYLETFLASPIVQKMINDIQVGATREALTKSMIELFEIPLPPVDEQYRIVHRIDQCLD
jgi:type I restriction enzyme, S subunit